MYLYVTYLFQYLSKSHLYIHPTANLYTSCFCLSNPTIDRLTCPSQATCMREPLTQIDAGVELTLKIRKISSYS